MNAEAIRAITPLFLGFTGLVIAVTAIVSKPSVEVTVAAFSLASAGLGGAGGLAVSGSPNSARSGNE